MPSAAPAIAIVTIERTAALSHAGPLGLPVNHVAWTDGESALTPDALRQHIEATGATVALMAADVPQPLAVDVARLLDEALAPTGVVLLAHPSPEAWQRAAQVGIRSVVDPAAPTAELRRALVAESTRITRLREAYAAPGAAAGHGRIIVVLSPKGGSGKTMLATNLAVALARSDVGDVALVDLDCVFGDISSVIGLVPERTIGQLNTLPSFDSTMLKVFLTRHEPSGLHILASSGQPEDGDAVTSEVATKVLTMLAHDMAVVVVDTAAGLDERALAAVDVATDLVLLASLDVASIRELGREIATLDRLGATSARRHFVLNRADAEVGLDIADVEAAIGMKMSATLPSSRMVPLSMNQARILVLTEPTAPVTKELLAFAATFAPSIAAARAPARQRRLFRRRS